MASCQDVEDCLLGWGLIIRVVLPGQCDQIVGWKHLCCRELNVACMKRDCKQKRASKKRQSRRERGEQRKEKITVKETNARSVMERTERNVDGVKTLF